MKERKTHSIVGSDDTANARGAKITRDEALDAGRLGRLGEGNLAPEAGVKYGADDDVDALELLDQLLQGPAQVGRGDFDAAVAVVVVLLRL
jgi:hypothetical protein